MDSVVSGSGVLPGSLWAFLGSFLPGGRSLNGSQSLFPLEAGCLSVNIFEEAAMSSRDNFLFGTLRGLTYSETRAFHRRSTQKPRFCKILKNDR